MKVQLSETLEGRKVGKGPNNARIRHISIRRVLSKRRGRRQRQRRRYTFLKEVRLAMEAGRVPVMLVAVIELTKKERTKKGREKGRKGRYNEVKFVRLPIFRGRVPVSAVWSA